MQSQPTGSLGSDKPKREAILDLAKYVNQNISVKFTGGREGIVKLCYHVPKKESHILWNPSDRNPERL